ncbi:hypothetical protein 1 [Wuhan insect virus 34]|uniref:hypothetical protein 1 n=1 Tax=Wuhan insect virus 34 TaxID=1923737 RepID=UPI00090A60C0|nr:hypothetical protein 1 [Wuhan insect virus 34]APG75723.1 hypothetical protein 1 [Wuhan insect virus 34]
MVFEFCSDYSSAIMTSLRRELAEMIRPSQPLVSLAELPPIPEAPLVEGAVRLTVEAKRSAAGVLWSGLRRGVSSLMHASLDGAKVAKECFDSLPSSVKVGGLIVTTAVATHLIGKHKRDIDAKVAKFRDMFRPEMKVVMAVGSTAKILESKRAGSEESDMTAYKGQCQIGCYDGSKFVVTGAALRFASNYLVGPDHVLGASNLIAKGRQGRVPLDGKERIPLATDLVAILLTDAEFANLGVSEVKIGVFESSIYAQVVGPLGKGTTGALKDDNSCFGRVIYEGTTLPGYSGSAYSSGSYCYGMHQCGGQVNGGFSASFIWCLLRIHLRRRDEDTADHLMREFSKGKGIYWSTSHTDPSEVIVRINGRYEYHSTDTMYDVFGNDWMNKTELKRRGRDFQDFKDVEFESAPVSGESRSLKSGGSGILESPQDSLPLSHQSLMKEYQKLSKDSKMKFRKSLGMWMEGPTTSGRVKSGNPTS